MAQLYDAERGTSLGSISEEQLRFLVDALEEESATDQEYYLTPATVDMLEEQGADAQLLGMLRQAMTGREEMEVRWEQE